MLGNCRNSRPALYFTFPLGNWATTSVLHPSLVSFHSSSQKKLAWDPSALFLGAPRSPRSPPLSLFYAAACSASASFLLPLLPSTLRRLKHSNHFLFFPFSSLPYRSLVRLLRNHDDNRQPRETRREKESERAKVERAENERDGDRNGPETLTTIS